MAYVYRHIRLDKNQPFYIGMGTDNNGYYMRAYSKHDRNKYWHHIVDHAGYSVDVLVDNISTEEAIKKEIEFISFYKKFYDGGVLCNLTDGGQGAMGLKHSQSVKDEIGKRNIGNKNMLGKRHSDESKLQMSINSKGKKLSEITKAKIKIATTGERNPFFNKKHTQETKNKISAANKGRSHDVSLETRVKIGIGHKGKFVSEETRRKLSDSKSIPVLQYSKDGKFVATYKSATDAALLLFGSDSNIIQCCKNKRQTHKGFIWEYKL